MKNVGNRSTRHLFCGISVYIYIKNFTRTSSDTNRLLFLLGVNIRNMKMDFNTEGTWRRIGQNSEHGSVPVSTETTYIYK